MHSVDGCAESLYETFVEGDRILVTMKVKGNFTGYTHDPCHWLNSTYFESGGRAMCWTGRPIGDSWIITFREVPKPLVGRISVDVDRDLCLVSSLKRNDHYGGVAGVLSLGDESSFKPMLGLLKLRLREIRSCGPYVWMGMQKTRSVLVPKDLIESVAIKLVGMPRDKHTLRICIQKMQLAVRSDALSIPMSMRADCIIYGSSLAFVMFVKEEIESFNRLCTPYYMKLYSRLAGVMNLEHWVCCCGAVEDDEVITVTQYNADRSSATGPVFDAKKAWPLGLPGYESRKPLTKPRPNATIRAQKAVEATTKGQFHAVCTTFQNYIPLVPYASETNEAVAIANRALMDVPAPEPRVWAELDKFADKYVKRFRPVSCEDPDRDFLEWNSRFPKGRAKNQADAYETLKTDPLCRKDYLRKAFCKRELTMKGGPVPEEFDPRAIQGNSDRLNAAYGPFTYKVSEQLKALWHENHLITYTGGMTAEQIGAWRAQFAQDVTIVECDESRYDCHQGKQVHDMYGRVEKRCGSDRYPNVEKARQSMRRIEGWTSKGVKYGVDYTMTSGSPTTSTSNSFINGIKTAYIMKMCGFPKAKMLVHGDDSLIVIGEVLNDKRKAGFVKKLKEINRKLGFETKVKVSNDWSQVEYCSSLFWPVKGGYVLGPKVGKRLPKIGFTLRELSAGQVKGMLIGLQIECGYIPVLREYAAHQLTLMSSVKKKQYQDLERRHKSLPQTVHETDKATIDFFFARYGVRADVAIAELHKALTGNLTDCVNYSLLEEFVRVDV